MMSKFDIRKSLTDVNYLPFLIQNNYNEQT
jgi:hypothetical protein